MSKHRNRKSRHHASKPAPHKEHAPVLKSGARKRMLYALAAGTAVVIAWGVFALEKKPAEPRSGYTTLSSAAELTGASVLTSAAPRHDFGRVSMAAGKVSHRYSILNAGVTPLTITKISTSCMCTTATLVTRSARRGPFGMAGHGFLKSVSERLAPAELAHLEVVFDPAAHGPAGVGWTERTVTIVNDAGPSLELRLSAMVTP